MPRRRKRRFTRQSGQPDRSAPTPVSDDKRTDWEKWDARIRRSRTLRKEWVEEYHVKDCEQFFYGKQHPAGSQNIVLNRIYATVKTIQPNLLFKAPKFYIRAKPGHGASTERQSQIGEGVMDAIGSQDDHLAKAAALAVFQSFFRLGVLKVTYDNTMEPNPQKGDPVWAYGADGLMMRGPDGAPQQAIDPMSGKAMTEPAEVMTDEVYRYRWVDSRFMLLPDAGPDQDQWPWIGEEITVLLDEAKKDQRFPAERRKLFVSNLGDEDQPQRYESGRTAEKKDDEFRYFEVYDITEKRVLRWAHGQQMDDFLSDDPLPDGIEDHPYSLLGYTIIQGEKPSPWPVPLVYPWLDMQEQYNIKRIQVTEGGKRAARKVAITADMFPDEEQARSALQSPNDMETFTVNDLNRTPRMVEAPPLSADIYKDIGLLNQDWITITGQTGARSGSPEGDTATEAMFVERAANLRDADLQGAVQSWLTVAGKKMWQLARQTLTLDLLCKLRGYDDNQFKKYVQDSYGVDISMLFSLPGMKEAFREKYGQETWLHVTRDELAFEADISVVPGSQRPQTLDTERKVAFEFLGFLGQFPQLAMSRGLLGWIAGKFDPPIPEAVVEELHLLSQKMTQVAAHQAGRDQGQSGTQNGGGANDTSPLASLAPLMQALAGGGMG